METILLNGGRIRVARTEIDVRYKDETITYVFPLRGPNTYTKVMAQIGQDKLKRPTTLQKLILVDFAIKNPNDSRCKEILRRFNNNHLWTATENLSYPEGVLVYDNIDGKMPANSRDLLERLQSGDKLIRHVESGFKIGTLPISDFLEHQVTVAHIGEDGEAVRLTERVAKYCNQRQACVYALDRADSDVKKFTALSFYWSSGFRLGVGGVCHLGGAVGSAAGIQK